MITTTRSAHELLTVCAMRLLGFASILVVGFLASPASFAQADPPPTVVDQYTEQIPSPGGEPTPIGSIQPGANGEADQTAFAGNPSGGPGSGDGSQAGGESRGAPGASNPSSGQGGAASNGSAAGGTPTSSANRTADASKSGSSVIDGIAEGGMGIFFPLILIASLMIASAAVFMRRQGDSDLDRSYPN